MRPKYAVAYSNEGLVFASQNKSDKAIAAFTKAIEANGNYAKARFHRAVTYMKAQKPDLACADLNAYLALKGAGYLGAGRIRTTIQKLGGNVLN